MRYGSVQNAEIHLFCSENRNFDIKIQAISLKKSRNIKIFYRYRRVMIQFNDLIYNSFVKYDFAINENELSDISKRGGGIDGFKFRQIIF